MAGRRSSRNKSGNARRLPPGLQSMPSAQELSELERLKQNEVTLKATIRTVGLAGLALLVPLPTLPNHYYYCNVSAMMHAVGGGDGHSQAATGRSEEGQEHHHCEERERGGTHPLPSPRPVASTPATPPKTAPEQFPEFHPL